MIELLEGAFLVWFIAVLILLSIWDMVWKGIGMWKSARQNQLGWFICIFIFNTIGILPIAYLFYFQKKKK
ncbi:MAG TPA: DUF5652 family protein [Candidatus Nanoarchaeia archaeon]|nr:DUF5652 family protein [Candidatus Nanoarchaeia archaeon]